MNAACEVICDEWRDVIQRNACEGGRNEGQSVGMALSMSMDEVDEFSWHQFAHPCI